MRPHGNQMHLEQRRRRAVELLKKGLKPLDVAAKIGCSLSSVYLWCDMIREKGPVALKAKPVPGRPEKMTRSQKRRLTKILLDGALDYGYSTDLWTGRRVAEVIKREFGIDYHCNHMWRFLQGLGWSCQKPEKKAYERDEAKIEQWKRYKWTRIKKN